MQKYTIYIKPEVSTIETEMDRTIHASFSEDHSTGSAAVKDTSVDDNTDNWSGAW